MSFHCLCFPAFDKVPCISWLVPKVFSVACLFSARKWHSWTFSSTIHKLQRLPWENYEIKMNASKSIYGDWGINDRIFLYFLYMQITDTFNARRK